MVDYGTDLSWNKSEVSLGTVTGDENLIQSVTNRLNTTRDELGWIYNDYGCNYYEYLGLKRNTTSLEFIKNSIKQALDNDDRIKEYNLELSYIRDGSVNVLLNINGVDLELELGG